MFHSQNNEFDPTGAPFESDVIFPAIVHGPNFQQPRLALPPEMICGILAQGEKGELIGGSKSFKTWSLIHQALCIAAGIPWWNFETKPNNVLFLNLEIPDAYFEARVREVAAALQIDVPRNFYAWHLRNSKLGDPSRWYAFLAKLKDECAQFPNPFLTSDPIYKLLGGRNENAAGDVAKLLEQLDDMVAATGGANFFGHHFAKGLASEKEAIDRGSGSGVFQRDPDSIFVMTPHETEGAFTVEAILRNHSPIQPFVIQWDYPIFKPANSLDPEQLRPAKKGRPKHYNIQMLADLLANDELSTKKFCQRVMDETGMSRTTFHQYLAKADEAHLIAKDGQSNTWERCSK